MGYKDILVCLDPTDAGESRLRLAAALARRCDACLSAVYIMPEEIAGAPPYGLGPPTGAAWFPATGIAGEGAAPGADPALRPDAAAGAQLIDLIEQRFRAEQPHPIEGDWHLLGSGESEDLLRLARTADLVIFGQGSPDYHLPTGYRPDNIILGSGRPTLVVPYAGHFAGIGRRAVVAWDGSREAARALHDALPLLEEGATATVVTVRGNADDFARDRPSLDRIVRHLGRHGVGARPEEIVRGRLAVGDILLNCAADFSADMIIAGAYHHSQLRESLFGGASAELLDHTTLPLLMSH
jgi:nucleotide-binding universal stress UspA family protein